jgi:hypothetical protein
MKKRIDELTAGDVIVLNEWYWYTIVSIENIGAGYYSLILNVIDSDTNFPAIWPCEATVKYIGNAK